MRVSPIAFQCDVNKRFLFLTQNTAIVYDKPNTLRLNKQVYPLFYANLGTKNTFAHITNSHIILIDKKAITIKVYKVLVLDNQQKGNATICPFSKYICIYLLDT